MYQRNTRKRRAFFRSAPRPLPLLPSPVARGPVPRCKNDPPSPCLRRRSRPPSGAFVDYVQHPVKAEKPWLRRACSGSSSEEEGPACREHKLWSNDDYFKMEKARQAKQEALEASSQSPTTPAASESLDRARALAGRTDAGPSPLTPSALVAAGESGFWWRWWRTDGRAEFFRSVGAAN